MQGRGGWPCGTGLASAAMHNSCCRHAGLGIGGAIHSCLGQVLEGGRIASGGDGWVVDYERVDVVVSDDIGDNFLVLFNGANLSARRLLTRRVWSTGRLSIGAYWSATLPTLALVLGTTLLIDDLSAILCGVLLQGLAQKL